MSVDDDNVASYHSHRRASACADKSEGFPTHYNPLHVPADAKDRYGIRPLNHGTLSFDLNAAAVPATSVCLPSPSAATPTCLPSSNAAECTAPSASAFPASAVSPRSISRVDAFDEARDWQHAIRKTFYHDPKFIVTSPQPPMLCCSQHGPNCWRLRRAGHGRRLEADARGSDRTLG
jgi:hypothetical protein